ncbi:hypothetical protein VTG60DRAFT_2862 [Thermothelomyces hinnuleus]
MSDDIPQGYRANYEQFRDALSSPLIERIAAPFSGPNGVPANSPGPATPPPREPDTADFTSYIAASVFLCLTADLQSLTYHAWADDPSLRDAYPLPLTPTRAADLLQTLDPSVPDSLAAYGITAPPSAAASDLPSAPELFASVLSAYLAAATAPPPPPSSTRARAQAEGCEICGRDWRGWHRRDELQNVAWLCGACHRFVHQFRGHEELAREYYTVERLLAADRRGEEVWRVGREGKVEGEVTMAESVIYLVSE